MISPLTPLDFLARAAYTRPDATAVVDGARRFTYAEFAARVERQAAALVALGVAPGDRVAVLAPNTTMALEAHFAPMRIGAVLASNSGNEFDARLASLQRQFDHAGLRKQWMEAQHAGRAGDVH